MRHAPPDDLALDESATALVPVPSADRRQEPYVISAVTCDAAVVARHCLAAGEISIDIESDRQDPEKILHRMRKLRRPFYERPTVEVARDLLGAMLVHRAGGETRIGRIVEVEAYLGAHDLAAHSSKGITPRTRIMYGPPGYVYVYLIYGMHNCMNVVTEPAGHGCAVLLRALEPVCNLPGNTSGPGLLCKAMGIDRGFYGHDLESDDLFVAAPLRKPAIEIVERPRIGVSYAGEWAGLPLRFYIEGNRFVSRK
jgi:DNA-3-methyladenine glycosylase